MLDKAEYKSKLLVIQFFQLALHHFPFVVFFFLAKAHGFHADTSFLPAVWAAAMDGIILQSFLAFVNAPSRLTRQPLYQSINFRQSVRIVNAQHQVYNPIF